ncbi:polyprenyl synthetase family protein [Plantactinospora endophytica]|uniref:Polyprenyl synthetase n=1 Tax=Plantactinospora endophytica TaxID=673535 RepID=A0ABQ4E0X6_9ACTN|nr:polyprenyl synthetase family protein [Plantactinospora endophytica]GIG88356.1 polyprenyl synthetase [Plantactinospora endophytica]
MTRGSQTGVDDPAGWLADIQAQITPEVMSAVDRLNPWTRRVCGYQLGWLDRHGRPDGAPGGKAIRPALALASARAVGGATATATAMPAAVAVELLHTCTLLQDDVMDQDPTRRHRPAAWTVFGPARAILAGDSLLALAFEVLSRSGHPAAAQAANDLAATIDELIEGQSMDLAFEGAESVSLADCVRMSTAKTGSLLACACRLGGLFGGAGEAARDVLARFGRHLGMAYQLRDDLLGIWGDPRQTGKPALVDLRRRKKSLPVAAALAAGNDAADQLGRLYTGTDPLTGDRLARAARLVEEAGGRAWAERAVGEEVAAAGRALTELSRHGAASRLLAALGDFVAGRDR